MISYQLFDVSSHLRNILLYKIKPKNRFTKQNKISNYFPCISYSIYIFCTIMNTLCSLRAGGFGYYTSLWEKEKKNKEAYFEVWTLNCDKVLRNVQWIPSLNNYTLKKCFGAAK